MGLSSEQITRFYHIWFELLRFVNEQHQIIPDFPATAEAGSLPTAEVMELRKILWADDTLLEQFVATNPAGLSSADLALVASWRYRKVGSFYIFRTLKAYTIFLTADPPQHAYGVQDLISPIEDLTPLPLPVYVDAVLLPFEGQITYDSMFRPYPVSFGANIRRRLNDEYRNAKEWEGIITSLTPVAPASVDEQRTLIEERNAKILQAFRRHLSKTNLSLKIMERDRDNIQTFAQTILLPKDPPQGLLEIAPAELQTYLQAAKEKSIPTSLKRFIRFLAETERIDFEEMETLLQALKEA